MRRRKFMGLLGGASAAAASGPLSGSTAARPFPRSSALPAASSKEGPASTAWLREANRVVDEEVAFQERFIDSETGVAVLRLTSQPCVNHNIYPEAPISTPDGKRFIFARRTPLAAQATFWIADLDLLRVRRITDEDGASAPVVTPDGRWFYYSVGHTVKRMSPDTFERETVTTIPEREFPTVRGIASVDYSGTRFLTPARDAAGRYGLACVDLAAGTTRMIMSGPDLWNPHGQYSKNAERKVLIQVNHGLELDAHGNLLRLVGPKGASLVVADDDGRNAMTLKAGFSMLERVQGHQCWVGTKSVVITTLHNRTSETSPWVQDRIVTIVPGEAARIVSTGQAFTHMHTTPDGEFWVSDSNRTGDIFIGSIRTGKYKLFHRSGSTFGSAQESHPHPFFLGDGKTVGWNSDVTGVAHIYCARIPEGFLDALL
jgi:Tol biopolymer transport system component